MVPIPQHYHGIVQALATSNHDTIVKALFECEEIKKGAIRNIKASVASEIAKYCQKDTNALLRSKGTEGNDLTSFRFDRLQIELEQHTPIFWNIVQAAAYNPTQLTNKKKTRDSIKPAVISAAAKIISIYCDDMNLLRQINSVVLKKGGLKKTAFTRMHHTYDAMSYQFTTELLDSFAGRFDTTIKLWKEEWETNDTSPGYTLANDNVDWDIKVRHISAESQNKSEHKINLIAYKNRVSSSHLPENGPQKDIAAVPLSDFLPGIKENIELAENLVVLVGHIWADSIPALSWFKQYLPKSIWHPYKKEMKTKSTRTQLGCYNYDQKCTDDVREFLTEIQGPFIPQIKDDGKIKRVVLRADYLGFERQKKAQSHVQDARTPSDRLEGYISALADFHAQAEWHKVIWHYLYDTKCAKDQGTLYQLRLSSDSRNVTKNPHDNFYAAEDLIEKFTHGYLVAGALHHFGMEDVDKQPTANVLEDKTKHPQDYVRETILSFLNQHVLNPPPSINGENELKCRYCGMAYKQKKRHEEHERKHREALSQPEDPNTFQCKKCGKVYKSVTRLETHAQAHEDSDKPFQEDTDQPDYVLNYTHRALALCCLWLNMEDAVKLGDGERLMLCYKFMYLYCKDVGFHKYAYGLLETVVQAEYLLPPRYANDLVWNRFVNNQGKEDTNLPVDLDVEHCNRPLKTDVHTFRGKLTDKTVQRISRSVEESEKVLLNVDRQIGMKQESGKHDGIDVKGDISKIVKQLQEKKVFAKTPGREHRFIGKISADPLATLDMKDLRTWLKSTIREFKRKSYYNC